MASATPAAAASVSASPTPSGSGSSHSAPRTRHTQIRVSWPAVARYAELGDHRAVHTGPVCAASDCASCIRVNSALPSLRTACTFSYLAGGWG